MPQYVFTIRASADDPQDERTVLLEDDAAAFAYACQLARETSAKCGTCGSQHADQGKGPLPRDRLFNTALRGLRLTLPLFNDKALVRIALDDIADHDCSAFRYCSISRRIGHKSNARVQI